MAAVPGNGLNVTTFGSVFFNSNNQFTSITPGASGTVFMSTGTSSLPTWQSVSGLGFTSTNIQVITTVGTNTYTATPGMKYCIVELLGGGGGGGGTAATSGTNVGVGGGGGAGEYARGVFTAAQVVSPTAVFIGGAGIPGSSGTGGQGGAGGNSSFGNSPLMSAYGGQGGTYSGSQPNSAISLGGVGGVGGAGGAIHVTGSPGQTSFSIEGVGSGGSGGVGTFGGGAQNIVAITNLNGNGNPGAAAQSYGSGGGGAVSGVVATGNNGGAGFAGVCIITEFIS